MTKQHFIRAAEQVKAILDGGWTNEPPNWFRGNAYPCDAGYPYYDGSPNDEASNALTRAVWTAEAYILLFQQFNPLFNEARFLKACGLGA